MLRRLEAAQNAHVYPMPFPFFAAFRLGFPALAANSGKLPGNFSRWPFDENHPAIQGVSKLNSPGI